MVQFAELPMYGQQYYSWYVFRKDYWKIGIGYGTIQRLIERLERRGYRCNRTMNRQRALYLHSRAERGLMFYDKLTKHELQMFCHDRKLLTSKATKNDLKHELERADETATFDHFTKLPPELRLDIMEKYFESLSEPLGSGSPMQQPPISQVSRLMRQESLPIFYKKSLIRFVHHKARDSSYHGFKREEFFKSVSSQDFAFVQRFELKFSLPSRGTGRHDMFELRANVATGQFHVQCIYAYNSAEEVEQSKACVTEEMQGLANAIMAREGPHKLRKNDLTSLNQIIDRIMEELRE